MFIVLKCAVKYILVLYDWFYLLIEAISIAWVTKTQQQWEWALVNVTQVWSNGQWIFSYNILWYSSFQLDSNYRIINRIRIYNVPEVRTSYFLNYLANNILLERLYRILLIWLWLILTTIFTPYLMALVTPCIPIAIQCYNNNV